jgi:riboflavin biosynthesis RibT protein
MVKALKEMYVDKEIISNENTAAFIEKCDVC